MFATSCDAFAGLFGANVIVYEFSDQVAVIVIESPLFARAGTLKVPSSATVPAVDVNPAKVYPASVF